MKLLCVTLQYVYIVFLTTNTYKSNTNNFIIISPINTLNTNNDNYVITDITTVN